MADEPEMQHVPADTGESIDVGGDLIKLRAASGHGLGSLFLELVCPPGGGPPPHTDPSEEIFYVLEGEFEFSAPDGPRHRATAGDTVIVPRRAAHTYRNVGQADGRLLVYFRDNEHLQPFFEELGEPVEDPASWAPGPPPDFERAMAVANRHGVHVVGPPPGA